MVDPVLSLSTRGLKDWFVQRVTSVLIAIYAIFLISYLLTHSQLQFAEWQALFANPFFKIFSFLVVFSTLLHAWVGMWTVFTDYIKLLRIRTILQLLVLILFFSCLVWSIEILWSV